MNIDNLNAELLRRNAFVVHCSRAGRGGEAVGAPKPLYPEDLRQTIRDLENGSGREVSCSVIWPAHQETFGAIGIVVRPRSFGDIIEMNSSDAGYIPGQGGVGHLPSEAAVRRTFEESAGHNEWVLTAADVLGIFVNLTEDLAIARKFCVPDDVPEDQRHLFGESVQPDSITLEEVARDFPGLPIFSIVRGFPTMLTLGHPYE